VKRALVYISFVVGIGALAWEFYAYGRTSIARWLMLFGIAWFIAEWNRVRWFDSVGLLITVAVAAYGLWLDLPAGWMLAGAMGALIAWDWSEFQHRIRLSALDDDTRGLETRHLFRLMIVVASGLAFSLTGLYVRLEFSFEWTAFLALLAALGMTQLVSRLRRGGE